MPEKKIQIRPQPGFQEKAIDCQADIAIIGGSAGCGKTFCLLYEPLKYYTRGIPGFNGIIFRRESVQISTTGGLWSKARDIYMKLPPKDRPALVGGVGSFHIRFSAGSDLQLSHLHKEDSVYGFQGADICYIAFDELTHFTEDQFFYMYSRNRSVCGVQPYIRASTNPQGEGWVKKLVSYWLYPDDYPVEVLRGFPIKERQGHIMYMCRSSGRTVMGRTPEDVLKQLPENEAQLLPPESIRTITFIAGTLSENQELLRTNPGYLGNLMSLSENERIKLLDGRWYDIDDDQTRIYPRAAVADIFTNTFVQGDGRRYITADIALEGADKFVVIVWDGWVVKQIYTFDKSMGNKVLEEIQRIAKLWSVPTRNITFDAAGVGGYLKGWLKTAFPFVGAAPPMEEGRALKIHGAKNLPPARPQYFNLRSQTFFYLREIIENCDIYIENVAADVQQRIEKELLEIRRMPTTSDQKQRIIPKDQIKKKLGFSPDYADAIAMRAVFDLKRLPERIMGRQVH